MPWISKALAKTSNTGQPRSLGVGAEISRPSDCRTTTAFAFLLSCSFLTPFIRLCCVIPNLRTQARLRAEAVMRYGEFCTLDSLRAEVWKYLNRYLSIRVHMSRLRYMELAPEPRLRVSADSGPSLKLGVAS